MLTYFDRQGRSVSEEIWHALFYGNSAYCRVKVSAKRTRRVVTSWVGVKAACEARRDLFLVQVEKLVRGGTGKEEKWEADVSQEEWWPTEEAALAAHARLEVAL